jgi:hypothetical protein
LALFAAGLFFPPVMALFPLHCKFPVTALLKTCDAALLFWSVGLLPTELESIAVGTVLSCTWRSPRTIFSGASRRAELHGGSTILE